ncbi:hypothetical protein D3C72_1250150 [compost metagenome]
MTRSITFIIVDEQDVQVRIVQLNLCRCSHRTLSVCTGINRLVEAAVEYKSGAVITVGRIIHRIPGNDLYSFQVRQTFLGSLRKIRIVGIVRIGITVVGHLVFGFPYTGHHRRP